MSQLLVLPRVAELRGSETKQEHHPGLTLDKFSFAVEQQEQKAALAPVCRCAGDEPLLRALNRRNDVLLAAGAAKTWTATTEGPLTLHLSRANALENAGIALHPLYGFAYLPGSGLKGAARAYAETIWLQAQPETEREAHSQQIARVFGCAPGSDKGKLWLPQTRQDADASEAGTVVFHDAWPEQWPGLFVDVAAVHHPDYYQASDSSVPPPGDWEPPKPISFLAIKPGTPFRFAVSPRSTGPRPDTALLGLAQNWLNGALATLGIGAKTAAGYGLFQSAGLAPAVLPPTRVAAAFDLTLVTPAFLAGGAQGQEDCDLRGATLRGQLRWWWRTLHAAHLEARLLRRLEAAVWGASSEGSAVQLRLMPGAATEVYRFNFKDEQDGTFLRDNGIDWSHRAAPESERRKTTQGLYYAAYGATPDRVEGRPKPGRFFRQPGSTWQLHLVARASAFRAEAGKDVIALTASGILQQAMAALFLLSRYGGVGAKARKGFGSFDDLDVDGIADISDCKRISAEFRARCGLTSQSSDGDAPSLERMSEPVVVPTSWKNAWFALNRIGEAMQTYAKTGKHEAWKSALGLPRRSDNRNAAFVVNGHLEPKVTDQRISRHLEGGRIKRHAAPVHFHVAKIGDRLAIRLVTFVSPHLPDEATSRQRLEALRSDVRSRLEACKNEGGTAPLSPKPKEVAARVDENDMRVGDVVKAELLEERTLKGGWKARHLPSGSVRSIQNSHMVPSDRKPGDIVDVQVPNRTEFKWPVEKPPPRPAPAPRWPQEPPLMPRALLLTVGTGDAAELETSLFAPLLLSIRQGDWGRVVLLPSLVTAPNADEVRRRLDAKVISIAPLPVRGAENDADACFDHFDRVIETLLAAGQAPADVVADFTRGTKAMSAALVLAAIRHGVPVLRYVAGQQRDQRGMAVAGSEHLRETRIARATARRRLDLARGLAEHASFGAALSLLPDPDNRLAALGWDTAEREALRALRPLVAFLAAWDRLDYAGAATIVLPAPEALPAAWRRHYPPAAVKHLVIRLAQWPRSDRLIAIDLLANAERRVTQGQYEDALVRVYNVVERIARARLADAGGGNEGRARNMDALEQRRDPLVPNLRALDRAHPSLQPAARNDSILVHGHAAPGSASPGNWPALLGAIGDVLRRDAALRGDTGALDRDLAAARFPMTWNEA